MKISSIGKFDPPDQEDIERRLREIFSYGDIRALSNVLGVPYSTLVKKLNPDCIEQSVVYKYLRFDWGCWQVRPELAEKIRSLVSEHECKSVNGLTGRIEFPSKLAFSVTETEINTTELEKIPLIHRVSRVSELIRQLESYRNGLLMDDIDFGGEDGDKRAGGGTNRAVRTATR